MIQIFALPQLRSDFLKFLSVDKNVFLCHTKKKKKSNNSDLVSYNEQLSNNYFVFHHNEKPSHNNDLGCNNVVPVAQW